MSKTSCGAILTCLLTLSFSVWADWPQFQGPARNGVSPEKGLARSWPDGGPRVLWTFPLGPGYGGAAIQDGKVYIMDRIRKEIGEDAKVAEDVLRCLDLATGREEWTFSYEAPGKVSVPGSRCTPCIDKDYIFIVGPMGHFYCISRKTHKPVWKKHLLEDFSGRNTAWGVPYSPVLFKNLVIVAACPLRPRLIAFEKSTGRLVWRTDPLKGTASCHGSFASPFVVRIDGVDHVIMISAKGNAEEEEGMPPAPRGEVVGFSAADGKRLWSYAGWQCTVPIAHPTYAGDGRLFLTGEYGAGSAMIQVKRVGDAFTVTELYKTDACGAQVHLPLIYDGHLYANSNGNKRRDGLVCLTLDGALKWRTRDVKGVPNFGLGALLLADGMIFAMDGNRGVLRLIQPDPNGYRELASAQVLEAKGGRVWAPMALSDGKLIVRDQKEMKCLDVRNP